MGSALKVLEGVAEQGYTWVRRWKEQHRKPVIGCVPMHFPEELVHAAGALPVTMLESREPISYADTRLPFFFCELARSLVDAGLRGNLGFFDGIIAPDTCAPVRGLSDIAKENFPPPFLYNISPPMVLHHPGAQAHLKAQLERVQASLGAFLHTQITPERLAHSIRVYNENRAAVRRLYALRLQQPGSLSARHMTAVVKASMFMPKEDHTALVHRLLSEISGEHGHERRGVPVILSGNFCSCPNEVLLDTIEEAGAVVVDDDLYVGYRYIANDAQESGDPLEALAHRYLNMQPPCPTRLDMESDWADFLQKKAQASGARGIISLLPKFCEPHSFYIPHLERSFRESNMPHLLLETSPEMELALGQAKTRVQAFVEMIGGP